ncbi:endonuclease domain-containing protein [Methylobacterium sp. CM6257]
MADDLARSLTGLGQGERLVIMGIGRDVIRALISDETERSALLVASEGQLGAEALIDRLLDDLAALALESWPHWDGCDASLNPVMADPWLKAASKRARLGLIPRFRKMGRDLELRRLSRLLDPAGVIPVWDVDPASATRAHPAIEALEWCTRQGAAVVTALTVGPPETAPYDRNLYGAYEFIRSEGAASERFIAPVGAHHASATERRVAEALAQDADLKDLFICNAPVPVGAWGARPRVYLLCRKHRIVVELDGPEHRSEPKFGNDRHRDYELLTAGYLVLRLTNDQVAADLPLAIEKIRTVVRLRRGSQEG